MTTREAPGADTRFPPFIFFNYQPNDKTHMNELYIPKDRPGRNFVNGRFLPGHVPHNKGKKWADYMDMRKARRIKRTAVKNLVPGGCPCAGWNARPVVALDGGRLAGVFPSSEEAGRKSGVPARNIRHCCEKKRKSAGGYRWFWEDDNDWCRLLEGGGGEEDGEDTDLKRSVAWHTR